MKVIVISDMEGISGIVRGEQTHGGSPMYEEGRKLYTAEMNAAVAGAKAAGATEIVLMDHHGAGGDWSFNSLIPEELDPDCEYVVQQQWTAVHGLSRGGRRRVPARGHALDGRHRRGPDEPHGLRAGLPEPLVQRDEGRRDRDQRGALRDLGLPRGAGDGRRRGLPRGKELLGDGVTTVEVKRGLGVQSARLLAPKKARELVRAGAEKALADLKAVEPYDPGKPCEIKVDFKWTGPAAKLEGRPGIEIVDPRTIVSRGDDWWTAWKQFYF